MRTGLKCQPSNQREACGLCLWEVGTLPSLDSQAYHVLNTTVEGTLNDRSGQPPVPFHLLIETGMEYSTGRHPFHIDRLGEDHRWKWYNRYMTYSPLHVQ